MKVNFDHTELKKDFEKLFYEDEDFEKITDFMRNRKRSIFDVIAKERDEITFTRTLKYFLDPNETHNLGSYFLRELLHVFVKINQTEFGREKPGRLYIDMLNLDKVNVCKEFQMGDFGRADIYIDIPGKLICIIENKLFSGEGFEQTKRYADWAAKKLDDECATVLLCFINPMGIRPESNRFLPVSFDDILPVFDSERARNLLSEDNRYLLDNFVIWMKEMMTMRKEIREMAMKLYMKHKDAIDFIVDSAPTIPAFLEDIAEYVNSTTSKTYIANSGKHWMRVSPKKWMEDEKMRANKYHSAMRLEYIANEPEKLYLALVVPEEDLSIEMLKENAEKIFGTVYGKVKKFKASGLMYHVIEEWESFFPENFIDNWHDQKEQYAVNIMSNMDRIAELVEPVMGVD